AALFRLRALHRRLCVELQGEEDLESQIELVLGENEYELCQVEVEQGKFSSLRREVQRDEEESETQRGWEANQRLQKEEAAVRRAELRKQLDRKIHQKETENELRSREEMERRTQAVLSLKTKITATKENIRAMQARDQAKAAVQKEEERRIRESVRREGGDVTKYMYQQKRLQEFERQKQAFEEQKKSRKVEILSKILQEEAQMEKRKKLLPDLFPKMQKSQDFMPESGKPSDKLLQYLEMMYGEADDESYRPKWRSPSPMSEDDGPISEKVSPGPDLPPGSQDYTEDGDSEEEAEESLAQPEFTGLWDQKHKPYKDFEVGKTYKKIMLTNSTYTINFCKLVGVSEQLRDFIYLHFDPPGQMSAGMACDLGVTFKPMLAVDSSLIDFGTHVVGETISRTITLSNRGALGTKFNLVTSVSSSAVRLTPEPSPLGQPVTEGELRPFGFVKLQIMFTPMIPGEVQMDFDIKFSDPGLHFLQVFSPGIMPKIPVRVRGVAIDVPVWVSKPNVDLKICMYDRLYQDSIPVHSRLSLTEDAGGYFDKETGVLEVPMTIHVADQTRPVLFAVHAVVTAFDLEFDRKEVDFGHCSIHESVQASVHLTNKSLLPQEFGFVGIPKYVDVQPNDGFGILLPMETVEIDIIFSAIKAKEYSFELTCKSGINRDFKLSCQAVGVHPPLELSHSLVQFGATAVNDKSTATLYVVNSHTSCNEFTHPVPRIGKGAIAPVGPTSFEFVYPEDSDITITPAVGTVLPGKVCFRPSLYKQQIQEEAIHMLCRAEETRLLLQNKNEKEAANAKKTETDAMSIKEPPSASKGKKKQKQASAKQTANEKAIKTCDTPGANSSANRSPFNPPKPEDIRPDPHNTLYLELHCPAVVPPLVVISDHGRSTVNFKEVAAGQTVVKRLSSTLLDPNGPFTLMNALRPLQPGATHTLLVSFSPVEGKKFYETLEIRTSNVALCLNLSGIGIYPSVTCSVEGGIIDFGYVLANESATSVFKLQNTSSILVNYCVKQDSVSVKKHKDQQGLPSFLTPSKEPQSLVGKGFAVMFVYFEQCTITCKRSQLQNTSSILVNYSVKQDSVSVKKHKDQQGLPSFLTPSKEPQSLVGTQNNSGLSVFCVSPLEGAINPGTSQDITVTFQPDHESLYYSDRLTVEIVNKEVAHVIQLKGSSRTHTMFVDGGDPLDAPVESLADLPAKEDPEGTELVELMKPILLTLKAACSENTLAPAVRELKVGCIRSTQPLAKKNVEFSFDNLNTLQQKGFNLDPGKGAVDPGQKKSITVTWAPPSGHDVSFTTGDEECEEHNTFILLAILVLVLCGVIVSCVKFCCRKDKPQGQTLTELPCEISVVAMDNQSTVHSTSTVTSFNSVQLPPDRYVPFPFGQVNKGFAPPPYNLYALEMPPPYDEALKMPIDPHENSPGNRKADNRPSQGHAGDSHLQQPPPSSEEELNVLNEQHRPQEHFDEVQLDDPPRYELHDISSPISEEDEND
ncbi:UNVERIFIED_CONTAM: hypothetical protein FKN15_060852, partial [Acipenser sinensis]